jgi:hypothetical protein
LTKACGDIPFDLSLSIKKGLSGIKTVLEYSMTDIALSPKSATTGLVRRGFAAQSEDCFADERSSLMQIKQFLRKDFGRQRSLDGTKPEQTR